jgi:peptidoglycan/LPS O-acetylase OafA/YrhL
MMILLGILSRFLLNNFLPIDSRDGLVGYQFTICCFDSLGFGGLLAYFFFYFHNELNQFIRKYFWLFGLAFVGFLLVEIIFVPNFGGGATLSRFLFSATCFGIIGYASLEKGFSGVIGRFLENPLVLYLGKISYGIYVYHIFAGRIFTNPERFLIESYNFSGTLWSISIDNLYLRGFLRLTLIILIAASSWHFFELPINRLKNKFPYQTGIRK